MQAIITNLAAMATAAGGKIILALLVLIIGNILIKSVLKFLGKSKMMDKAGRKILCKRFSTKSRMVLKSRADSGLNPLITESHGGQSGMRAGTA